MAKHEAEALPQPHRSGCSYAYTGSYFEHNQLSDPGYNHPGYTDVLWSDSLTISGLVEQSAGSSQQQPRRRRQRPLITTPGYPIELYDDEQVIPISDKEADGEQKCDCPPVKKRKSINDDDDDEYQHHCRFCCRRGARDQWRHFRDSRHKAHWDAFRKYAIQCRPVKIHDIALFRKYECSTPKATATDFSSSAHIKHSILSRTPAKAALLTDIHSLPPHILDTIITVQCAFPRSTSQPSSNSMADAILLDNNDDSKIEQPFRPCSVQDIDLAISASFANRQNMEEYIPTFMGQEDQVTTEMQLREVIEWRNFKSSSMAVCLAQLPIATSVEKQSPDNDDIIGNNVHIDQNNCRQSIQIRLDGSITHNPSEFISKGENSSMSHLSSMLRLPSYLLLGDVDINNNNHAISENEVSSNIAVHSINLWHAPQTCCTNFHYDDYDNLLIVTEGTKTVEICPPGCIRGSGIYSEHANHPALLRNFEETYFKNEVDSKGLSVLSEIEATRNLKKKQTHIVSVNAGEALYIPPGWWHRVESTSSSSNLGCTAINVWFDFLHSSRTNNYYIPRYMLPFQVRCITRRYYEIHAHHSAKIILQSKRLQAETRQMMGKDNTEDYIRLGWKMIDVLDSNVDDTCNILAESWNGLIKDYYKNADKNSSQNDQTTIDVIDRYRIMLEYFLFHVDLQDARHVNALVRFWTTLPKPTIHSAYDESKLFTELILGLSSESCYIITQAWERDMSRLGKCCDDLRHNPSQVEVSFKHFFELAGGSKQEKKVRMHLAKGVDSFRLTICQMGLLDGLLLGRV